MQLSDLIATVQHNCHIADARHAGDYTLCVYLLKMREMYRWEQGLGFKTLLTTDDVGEWLTQRESVWDEVEEQDYRPLNINERQYEPFDNELINTLLDNHNLVYNAGLGIRCRPHFFIADLEKRIHQDDYTIYISGREHARDMAAPAAMAQGRRIFIRRESLRRVIWEILDDARVAGLDNPLTRTMSFYPFEDDVEQALDRMTDVEMNFVIEHEIGEVLAGNRLGEEWLKMLDALARTPAEIMLRAVRDHLADSLTTLPALLGDKQPHAESQLGEKATLALSSKTTKALEQNAPSVHFYFGNMTAMRKHLAPGLLQAYEIWHQSGDPASLLQKANQSQSHWQALADDIRRCFNETQDPQQIESLIKIRKL